MSRQALTTICASVAVSAVVGFGIGSASRPPAADAAGSNADIVRQLKTTNAQLRGISRKLDDANVTLGTTQTAPGSVRGLLTLICNYTASVDCG